MNGNQGIVITTWILVIILVLLIVFQDKVKELFVKRAENKGTADDKKTVRINRVITTVDNGGNLLNANTSANGSIIARKPRYVGGWIR